MKFSQFITENNTIKSEATLVIHQIISMLDKGHVDMSDKAIRFLVGPLVRKTNYNNIELVVRVGQKADAKLAKKKDGSYAIVIDTTGRLPKRKEIDTLLAKPELYNKIVTAFQRYLSNYYQNDPESEKQYDDEIEDDNTSNFEENYEKLIADFTEKNIKKYEEAVGHAHSQIEQSANLIHTGTKDLVTQKLIQNHLGNTFEEFMTVIKELEPFSKFEKIDKELKEKLDARLKTFYHSKVKPMLSSK